MEWLKIVLLLVLGLIACAWSQDPPTVEIPGMGTVIGVKNIKTQWNKKTVYAFRGIPFGKSPNRASGMRYKPSVRVDPWTEPFDATNLGRICCQTGNFKKEGHKMNFWDKLYSLGDNLTERFVPDPNAEDDPEDCLNLNIYTTNLTPEKPLPVMVFFHGGAYLSGSSYIYQPNFLLDHGDVILVVPHYRLGPLGFLSMHDDRIPGNAGLFDKILALEWVRDYISAFGGDPNEVTAFGESAGAASVSLLSISPLATGLFKRIIAESGSAITEWAIDRTPVENARGIAKYLTEKCPECPDISTDELIVDCFLNCDGLQIIEAYSYGWKEEQMAAGFTGFGGSSPVVQQKGERLFIDKMPIEYWRDPEFTSVPAMYGANKHEGSYVMAIVYDSFLTPNGYEDDVAFLKFDSIRVFLDLFLIKDPVYALQDALEVEYVGADRMGNLTAMIPGMIDFAGATFLKGPSFEQMKMHAKVAGNSYWYAFNYFDKTSLWNFIGGNPDLPFGGGVTHANELLFLFNIPGLTIYMSKEEIQYARDFSNIWFNYGVYGETQPEGHIVEGVPADWKPYDPATDTYVRFDKEIELLTNFPNEYTIAKDEDFSLKPRE